MMYIDTLKVSTVLMKGFQSCNFAMAYCVRQPEARRSERFPNAHQIDPEKSY
jgi:hypothetical protein